MNYETIKDIEDFIDYVVDPENVMASFKAPHTVKCEGETENGWGYDFEYTYSLGHAYLLGNFGSGYEKIEVYYEHNKSFQIVMFEDDLECQRQIYPWTHSDRVKDLLFIIAAP
jgi:hypothetical protein